MNSRILLVGCVLALGPSSAWAVCGAPGMGENDCDEDGVRVNQGDCDDDPTACPTSGSCDPMAGPYTFGCVCGLRRGWLARPGFAEFCDGRDNDCNGQVDEASAGGKLKRACYSGMPASTQNMGVCRGGEQACASTPNQGTATWSACSMCPPGTSCMAQVIPSAETCNGIDDDCNGAVDNVAPVACYTGAAGTQNVGLCRGGTQACSGGMLGACSGQIVPVAEVCDGADNNCNGQIDDGNPGGGAACTVGGQVGVCAAGQLRCVAGALACPQVTMPTAETCNGRDDNCNGQTDEGLAGAACTATAAQGRCRNGTSTCSGGVASCSPGMPTAEVCNGEDDDCNGVVDDVAGAGGACTTGLQGRCSAGTNRCTNVGGWALRCQQTSTAVAETCNNQDDNCNGQTDEGLNGTACTATSAQGACRSGSLSCAAGVATCTAGSPVAETCNGVDDNCNGQTDDGIATVGDACATGEPGRCAAGTLTCNNMGGFGIRCVRNLAPVAEGAMCNGIDDNCNGQIDDGVSRVCYTGPAGTLNVGLCRGVAQTCSAGAFPACSAATPGQILPATETCNGVDDDCNGQVDEGIGGASCSTGLNGVCMAGTERCQGTSGLACVPNVTPGSRVEDCNNLDDNCNGQVDENVTPRRCYDGPAGTFAGTCPGPNCQPRGLCRASTQACNGSGQWGACGSAPGATPQVFPATEVCNSQDDNCNGQADDGLIVDVDADSVRACGTCNALPNGQCDCNDMNANIRPNRQELCNGVDDNCNMQTDEGTGPGNKVSQNCYSGMPATSQGVGICVSGSQVCTAVSSNGMPVAAQWGMCLNEVVPATEVCNGRDDDCDGQTDEGFDLDNDGFLSCSACGNPMNCDCNDMDRTIRPGAVEACDDVDQDCDGMLDDVMPRVCFAGANVTPDTFTGSCPGPQCAPKGVCRAGQQTCTQNGASASWGICAGQVLPANMPSGPELLCDSRDEDCDGTVDDGDFDRDMDGVRSCQGDCNDEPDGGARQRPGLLEVCDGIDNNCDMVVDGTNTGCFSSDAGRPGVGRCRAGMAVCMNGMPAGVCAGEVGPIAETCNMQDDDCDGRVDEDFDQDGDGVSTCAGDCDDTDAFNKPGGREICDCKDNNCNTTVDEGNVCEGAPCHDFDRDGYTNCQGDCDDRNMAVGPFRSEAVGNGIDDDCDGAVDENTDEDGDGVSTAQGDCDDRFAAIRPNAVEVCDGFDNNCNGRVDEGFDVDGDFATTCGGDCDDNNRNRNPFLRETCGNMVDDNCDGRVDEDADADQDGVTTCQNDCNDFNAAVHPANAGTPAAMEVCDGQDNDCNTRTDEGFDVDQDFVAACFGDCNDMNGNVNPNRSEVPGNGIDDNCNGQVDEGAVDGDGDGFTPICGDCNDRDRGVNPRAREVCDRIDNNCDSYVDSAPGRFDLCAVCFDADGDGQTNCDGDCNDADRDVFRGAAEVCDGKDNDCDTEADLDPLTGQRLCAPDAGSGLDGGFDDDAGVLADGGSSGDDGGVASDAGPSGRPVVITGCGCGSGGGGAGFLLVALGALLSRRRLWSVAPLLAAGLMACPTSIVVPLPDGGGQGSGGATGDDGGSDAGSDAGFVVPVPNWPCPGLQPSEQVTQRLPGTNDVLFAFGRRFRPTVNDAAQLLLLDDGPGDIAAFVGRRELPNDLRGADGGVAAGALELFATREAAALGALQGTPLVRDRNERSARVYLDDRMARTYSTTVTFEFAGPTNSFAVRNRLVAQLTGRPAADLGVLPVAASARVQEKLVVALFFRLTADEAFVGAVVTTEARYAVNQPTVADLSNGSHISGAGALLTYNCETTTAPPIKTDFIFVIDSSGSMREEQAALVEASEGLFAAFRRSGLDFRIGVVTTDSDVLRGRGFTNDLDQFKSDVRVGIAGNSFEMGIEYGLRGIRRARMQTNPDLALRAEAGLVVVFVSDEENTGLRPLPAYIADYETERAVAFAIVGPKPLGCTRVGRGSAVAGSEYIDLATRTGGSSGSICNANLTEVIEEVLFGALGASSGARLMRRPISGSLAVRTTEILPRARNNGFDYDPNRNTILFFGTIPATGAPFEAAFAGYTYIQ